MPVFNRRFSFKRKKKGGADTKDEQPDEEEEKGEQRASHEDNPDNPKNFYGEEILTTPLAEGQMPTFFHIGGWAKECLINGYKIGIWHIDCTTKASDYLTFYSYGEAKPKINKISGGVGIGAESGIFNMTQAWQVDGYLGTLGIKKQFSFGSLYSKLRGSYDPHREGSFKLLMNTGFERSPIKYELIIPIVKAPKLMGYVIVQPVKNFLLAYRAVYDIENKGFDKHAICGGFDNGSTELGLKYENFKDVRGSIFQRVGERWAFALKAVLYGEEMKRFAVGGQYQIDDSSILKAKIRDDGLFGLVYHLILSDNVEAMYHFGFDVRDPIKGEHKIGVSWSFNS